MTFNDFFNCKYCNSRDEFFNLIKRDFYDNFNRLYNAAFNGEKTYIDTLILNVKCLWESLMDEIEEFEINYYLIDKMLFTMFKNNNFYYLRQLFNFLIIELNNINDKNINIKTIDLFNTTQMNNLGYGGFDLSNQELENGSFQNTMISNKQNDIFTMNRYLNQKTKNIFETLKINLLRIFGRRVL